MRTITFYILATTSAIGCGNNSEPEHTTTAMADIGNEARAMKATEEFSVDAAPPVERKVIRSGELGFEVDDLDAARNGVLERVKASGGYVEGDERSDQGSERTVTLRVRVPATGLDAFVHAIHGLGRLEHQRINTTDVTAEWVDVEARLTAKRALEKRYLELAAQAKNVEEMLHVERAMGEVRAEIESMEGRMKTLGEQVAMSQLTITCYKQQAISERFSPRFGIALREGWNNLLRFLVGLTHLWPFVLAIGAGTWWLRKRRGQAKAK